MVVGGRILGQMPPRKGQASPNTFYKSARRQAPFPKIVSSFHATPNAYELLASQRSLGYSPESAIADLIDNSITAGASRVLITLNWSSEGSWIAVLDDGNGMSMRELREAMRLGTQPVEGRRATDLGCFGFGLKTASLSLGRRFTVKTRKGDCESVACLDLLHQKSNPFEILEDPWTEDEAAWEALNSTSWAKTIVLISDLDRLGMSASAPEGLSRDDCLSICTKIKEHLGMVFHRFISRTHNPLQISVALGAGDGAFVLPWNPFATPGGSPNPEDHLVFQNSTMTLKGFVLPHPRTLNEDQERLIGGPAGWVDQQGFYVYRNDRMLIPGSWLGVRGWKRSQHHKLARIRLDVPPDLDGAWRLDVKKTTAIPPAQIMRDLKIYGERIRARALEVFHSRARISTGDVRRKVDPAERPVWVFRDNKAGRRYLIDRGHPLIKGMLQRLTVVQDKNVFRALLKVIARDVPVERIWLDQDEDIPVCQGELASVPDRRGLEESLVSLLAAEGYSILEAQCVVGNLLSPTPIKE